jgi:hypothetical protein
VNHARPGFKGRPRGWWYKRAVLRVGEFECFEVGFEGVTDEVGMAGVVVVVVGDLDLEVLAAADEGVVNGFGAGNAGGERSSMNWTRTWASVVVIGARASTVMPDHLCEVDWRQRQRFSD